MRELRRQLMLSLVNILVFAAMAGSTFWLFGALTSEHAENVRQHDASRKDRAEMRRTLQADHEAVMKALDILDREGVGRPNEPHQGASQP